MKETVIKEAEKESRSWRRRWRWTPARLVLVLLPAGGPAGAGPREAEGRTWTFEGDCPGAVPAGFVVAEGEWRVEEVQSGPGKGRVLAQVAKSSRSTFNVILAGDASFRDLELSVRLEALAGEIDQGGGLVWRARDAQNYYIARYNPLEDNYRVYKVAGGRRLQLGSAGIPRSPGWHTLRVTMEGDRIRSWYDGKLHLDVRDSTFQEAGTIGLWTKADAQSRFDELRVRPLDGGLVWESLPAATPPEIDGVAESVWEEARPLAVTVRKAFGGGSPRTVTLRALHGKDVLYVLAQWPDATRSDLRDPYTWSAERRVYSRTSRADDQFALELPMEGEFDVSMLPVSRDYVADVWHWKAGRGNPAGWVDDKRHRISHQRIPEAREYSLGGRTTVYIARLMDSGTPSYAELEPPAAFEGELVDSYRALSPTGSLADIRGKGRHDGAGWTLEMCRKLNTGHEDDAVLDPGGDNPCAIAVLDDELFWEHSVSPLLILRFIRTEGSR